MAHTRQKFVSLLEPLRVPTVTRVNTCPSARKKEGKRNVMQRLATLSSVVWGDQWSHTNMCSQNKSMQ
jgi:hypothetical protein